MFESIGRLYGTFRGDTAGDKPVAFRLHPEDWYRLLSEVVPSSGWMGEDRSFMGMTPLIDHRWPKGFPVCLGTKGAAEAMEAGARRPR